MDNSKADCFYPYSKLLASKTNERLILKELLDGS